MCILQVDVKQKARSLAGDLPAPLSKLYTTAPPHTHLASLTWSGAAAATDLSVT